MTIITITEWVAAVCSVITLGNLIRSELTIRGLRLALHEQSFALAEGVRLIETAEHAALEKWRAFDDRCIDDLKSKLTRVEALPAQWRDEYRQLKHYDDWAYGKNLAADDLDKALKDNL